MNAKLYSIAFTGRKHGCCYGNRSVCKQSAKRSRATGFKAQIHPHWMHRELWKQKEGLESTLMMRCVAEQILGNLLEILSTNRKTYSLDYEVVMEAELNELNLFRYVLFKSSKERQLIERNDCLTVMMKFGIIGKTMNSNEETVFRKSLVVLCEQVTNSKNQ